MKNPCFSFKLEWKRGTLDFFLQKKDTYITVTVVKMFTISPIFKYLPQGKLSKTHSRAEKSTWEIRVCWKCLRSNHKKTIAEVEKAWVLKRNFQFRVERKKMPRKIPVWVSEPASLHFCCARLEVVDLKTPGTRKRLFESFWRKIAARSYDEIWKIVLSYMKTMFFLSRF